MTETIRLNQDAEEQGVEVVQSDGVQEIGLAQKDAVQEIGISQSDEVQRIEVEEQDDTQSFAIGNDATFLKGDKGDTGRPGFSPVVEVEESESGHTVTITDAEGEKSFFVAHGEEVEVVDAATGGDMRPITSNAVRVEIGNIDVLLKTI